MAIGTIKRVGALGTKNVETIDTNTGKIYRTTTTYYQGDGENISPREEVVVKEKSTVFYFGFWQAIAAHAINQLWDYYTFIVQPNASYITIDGFRYYHAYKEGNRWNYMRYYSPKSSEEYGEPSRDKGNTFHCYQFYYTQMDSYLTYTVP